MVEPTHGYVGPPAARVLVVDDDAPTVRMVQFLLEAEGMDVASAADGKTALREYAAQHPDLILLNVIMPGTNGFQMYDRLLALGYQGPVVFITARPDIPEVLLELHMAVAGCLVKPLHPDALLRVVQDTMSRYPRSCWAEAASQDPEKKAARAPGLQ
ncbi:MAG: response regulator transcription factor [Chloroflexota bacterium]